MPPAADGAKANRVKLIVAGAALALAGGFTTLNLWGGPRPSTPEPGSGMLPAEELPSPKVQKVAEAAKPNDPAPAVKPGQTPPDRRFGQSDGNRMIPTDAPKDPSPGEPKPGN
jgi:hypothetical protein